MYNYQRQTEANVARVRAQWHLFVNTAVVGSIPTRE